jgi:CubicO group peptidase (beta-lactamase class C family)
MPHQPLCAKVRAMRFFLTSAIFLILSSQTALAEKLTADTPKTTAEGNTFIAPAGWSITQRGPATILEAPEGGSFVALVDINATDADSAVAAAWAAYRADAKWPLKVSSPLADRDGWTNRKSYDYVTSPNEKRSISASASRANNIWTVAIYDVADAIGEKRSAQVSLIYGKLLPKGKQRESFAGKRANQLDAARIEALKKFVENAMQATRVPGVSFGLYQDKKVVFAGGLGVRELGKPGKVDADTRYMIASNTKAMATLMLAKLVEAKKLGWETTAASVLPSFKLGDAETTKQVQIKHLICACTGMPRQDLEWLFEHKTMTPDGAMKALGEMQPTSKFGELFQYSNPMAAAAGYIGGHVAYPKLELGAAYDKAMQTMIFDPLGMKATTHDFKVAERGNFAAPHAPDINGAQTFAEHRLNKSVIPVRPAGGLWSTVNDMLKYVAMELDGGKLSNGKQYISEDVLLARRAPQVVVGTDITYGMGLFVNTQYGTPVVHHGGSLFGFYSDMMWLPEHGVGAVVLTNGAPGGMIRSIFRRKLLEVLFDGAPEADQQVAAGATSFYEDLASDRKLYVVPADPAEANKLAARYTSAALGEIAVTKKGSAVTFDFGEFSSEMATKKNPDGTVSFVTIAPSLNGVELIPAGDETKKPRTLTIRDAQHEYVFTER